MERHRDELAEEPEEIIDDSEDDLAVKNLRDRATLKFTNANGPYGSACIANTFVYARSLTQRMYIDDLAPPPNQQQRERPPFKATTEPCAHRTDTAKPQQDDRLKSAKAEIRSLKTANSEYRDLNAHLESQLEATNNAYSNAWNNLSEALTEIDRLNTVASEAHASHSQLSQEHAQLQKHCAELKNRLKGTENALSKTKSLLATRTEELDLAQAFMTTADRVSVADVKRMVSRLNDDIFQCAMSLSDSLLERKTSWQRECALAPEASMQAREEARKHLVTKYGEPLVVRLENESRAEETSILFESLVQSVWVYRCWSTIKRFYYTDHNVEKVLRELWERVKASSGTYYFTPTPYKVHAHISLLYTRLVRPLSFILSLSPGSRSLNRAKLALNHRRQPHRTNTHPAPALHIDDHNARCPPTRCGPPTAVPLPLHIATSTRAAATAATATATATATPDLRSPPNARPRENQRADAQRARDQNDADGGGRVGGAGGPRGCDQRKGELAV